MLNVCKITRERSRKKVALGDLEERRRELSVFNTRTVRRIKQIDRQV
jgi:hypothetical protein